MNKIVVPNHPVEKLPVDLRAGLDRGGFVTVTLDPDASTEEVLSLDEIFALADQLPKKTTEQIDRELSKLRDEWE